MTDERPAPSRGRSGSASLEAVLTTGVCFPAAVGLFYLGLRACRALYHVSASLVGWPYM